MGLYDTLVLEPVLVCPRCGKKLGSIQTKQFDSAMRMFRPGMFVAGCPVHTGIVRESTWCCPGPRRLPDGSPDRGLEVWLVIWHGIYAAYALDEETAQRKMDGIDRLDLLGWLDRMQQECRDWKSRYRALHHDLQMYVEYCDLSPADKAELDGVDEARLEPGTTPDGKPRRSRIHLMPLALLDKEIRLAADPIKALCAKHGPDQPVDQGFFGWD